MKRIFLACICYLLILPTGLWAKRIIKVACVGNSITYGAGISNREKNSYPAQLQYYLGDDYEVRNFGSNGATAQSDGDYPYVRTGVYGESKNFLPDIVLIKLGTNDTKPQNWKDEKHFMEEYQTLIDTYRSLDSHPQVILLTPVRCFLTEKNTVSPRIIEEKVRLVVEQLAYDNGLGIINLHNLFGNQWDQVIMPDRLHPSSIGAGAMARKIGDYLLNVYPKMRPPLIFTVIRDTISSWMGFLAKWYVRLKKHREDPGYGGLVSGDMSHRPTSTCWSKVSMWYIAM